MSARARLIQSIAAPIAEARDLVDLHHAEVLYETPLFLAEYDSVPSEVHLTLDDARACCDDVTAAVAEGRSWDWSRDEDGVYVQFWTHEDDDRPLYLTGGTVTEVTVHRPEVPQEKDTAASVATSTPESDFFQPGTTYSDPDPTQYDWQFRCDTVTTRPDNGERTALGWRHFRGAWEPYAYREDDWDITQTCGLATTEAPRG